MTYHDLFKTPPSRAGTSTISVLPRETDGRWSCRQHTDEPGDRAAATLVSPRAACIWRGVQGVPPVLTCSQEGVSDVASVSCFSCITREQTSSSCRIARICTRQPHRLASAKSADQGTYMNKSAHLQMVDVFDKE